MSQGGNIVSASNYYDCNSRFYFKYVTSFLFGERMKGENLSFS